MPRKKRCECGGRESSPAAGSSQLAEDRSRQQHEPILMDADGWYLVQKCGAHQFIHYAEKHLAVAADGWPTEVLCERAAGSPLGFFQVQLEALEYEEFGAQGLGDTRRVLDDDRPDFNYPSLLCHVEALVEGLQHKKAGMIQPPKRRGRDRRTIGRDKLIVELRDKASLSWSEIQERLAVRGIHMTISGIRHAYDRQPKR